MCLRGALQRLREVGLLSPLGPDGEVLGQFLIRSGADGSGIVLEAGSEMLELPRSIGVVLPLVTFFAEEVLEKEFGLCSVLTSPIIPDRQHKPTVSVAAEEGLMPFVLHLHKELHVDVQRLAEHPKFSPAACAFQRGQFTMFQMLVVALGVRLDAFVKADQATEDGMPLIQYLLETFSEPPSALKENWPVVFEARRAMIRFAFEQQPALVELSYTGRIEDSCGNLSVVESAISAADYGIIDIVIQSGGQFTVSNLRELPSGKVMATIASLIIAAMRLPLDDFDKLCRHPNFPLERHHYDEEIVSSCLKSLCILSYKTFSEDAGKEGLGKLRILFQAGFRRSVQDYVMFHEDIKEPLRPEQEDALIELLKLLRTVEGDTDEAKSTADLLLFTAADIGLPSLAKYAIQELGVSVNSRTDPERFTPLGLALHHSHHALALELVAAGADIVDHELSFEWQPVFLLLLNPAEDRGLPVLLELIKRSRSLLMMPSGDSALFWALTFGRMRMFEVLIAAAQEGRLDNLDEAVNGYVNHEGIIANAAQAAASRHDWPQLPRLLLQRDMKAL
jgi:hypothetical protein